MNEFWGLIGNYGSSLGSMDYGVSNFAWLHLWPKFCRKSHQDLCFWIFYCPFLRHYNLMPSQLEGVIGDIWSHLLKNAINLSLGQEHHQVAMSEWWGGPGLYISLDILTAWADSGSCSPSVYFKIFQEDQVVMSKWWGVIAILNHSVPTLHHFDDISNRCLASQMYVIVVQRWPPYSCPLQFQCILFLKIFCSFSVKFGPRKFLNNYMGDIHPRQCIMHMVQL